MSEVPMVTIEVAGAAYFNPKYIPLSSLQPITSTVAPAGNVTEPAGAPAPCPPLVPITCGTEVIVDEPDCEQYVQVDGCAVLFTIPVNPAMPNIIQTNGPGSKPFPTDAQV